MLIFPVPALQGILGWVTQLADGWPDAFAELDAEFILSSYEYMNYLLVVQIFARTP
jgi:hypothetical protein